MTPLGFSPEDEYEDTVRSGITATKNGSYQIARRLLERATRMKTGDPRPWLWLAETTDDPAEKRVYLEEAVAAEPHNSAARRRLAILTGKINPEDLLPVGEGISPHGSGEPIPAQTEKSFACPQCGGYIRFDIEAQQVRCAYCGYEQELDGTNVADAAEQPLDFVLPTRRGHRWAESQRQLSCQRCGAVTLWPVGQRATHCPYCGSSQLIETQETPFLVDPQAIGLIEIDEEEAIQRTNAWLGKGWFSPDDLSAEAQHTRLHPAYYPFWTFDGTMELAWHCDVQESDNYSDNVYWVRRSGSEFENFDDVLIPGNQGFTSQEIAEIVPFKLKEVVEFKPEYVADWPALTYDIPLAKASLSARKQVVKEVRSELHYRVLPHKQTRNINTGAVHWMDMTFKHVLLPLWVGSYWYQGKKYRVLVNGQTGNVRGEKPRDKVKATAIALSVFFTVIVILIFLFILAAELGLLSL